MIASSFKDVSLTESYCFPDSIKDFNVSIDGRSIRNVLDKNTLGVFNYVRLSSPLEKADGVVFLSYKGSLYKRVFSGGVDVRWYGAVGDGLIDDYEAVNKACETGLPVLFDNGQFLLDTDFEFKVPVIFNNALIKSDCNIIFNGITAGFNRIFDISGNLLIRSTEKVIANWFGVDGHGKACGGSINSGSNVIHTSGYNTFSVGDSVNIKGAGADGGLLSSVCTAVNGNTITIEDNASSSVDLAPVYNKDDSVALNRFSKALKLAVDASSPNTNGSFGCCTGYIPRGIYVLLEPLLVYAGCVISGEYANVLGSTILMQGDISKKLCVLVADNSDISGNSVGGNGNNRISDLCFKSAYIDDNFENEPCLYFRNAWNVHSDTEISRCLFQNTAGFAIQAGFSTRGSGVAGYNELSLSDGSTFRSNGFNIGGARIIVVGAGVAGSDLETFIVSGGGTNNVILNDPISTTVENAIVYPVEDKIDPIKIYDVEFDVCRGGIKVVGNVEGQIFIDRLEAFQAVRGVLFIDSLKPVSVRIDNSIIEGCGNGFNDDSRYRHSVFVRSVHRGGYFLVSDSLIKDLGLGFGGPMFFRNLEYVSISSCFLKNLDTSHLWKFLCFENNDIVSLKGCTLITDSLLSYENSRVIVFSNSIAHKSIDICGNNFVNNNVNSVSNFLNSDFVLSPARIEGNNYFGACSAISNPNISDKNVRNSYDGNNVVKYSDSVPIAGNWKRGDKVINSLPSIGSPKGWFCTVSGTPGTWVSLGNL